MSDQFVAEIRIFTGNFAPRGFALCDGQLLAISQNTALFSLLGTTYGGNGTSNFGLPNLQGRAPMHPGQGPGLSPHDLGEQSGSPTVTLLLGEMPQHNHTFSADPAAKREQTSVANNTPAGAQAGTNFYSTAAPDVNMSPTTLNSVGSSQPHDNMQPYLTVNFCIALQGIYPSRN